MSLWEFSRFFKPKNELIGIVVMLITFTAFYFGGRYAISATSKKHDIAVVENADNTLLELLSGNFEVTLIPFHEKQLFIDNMDIEKKGILLYQGDASLHIYAYKETRAIAQLESHLNEFHKQLEMQRIGLDPEQLATILSPAIVSKTFIFGDDRNNRIVLSYFFAGLMIMAVFLSFAYQFTAITGEKQLKITEQIVSAITPQIWIDGKIFGITLTGISSMLTYSVISIVGVMLYLQFSGTPISVILEYIHLPAIILYLPFALLGVLIWNAILAAIASIITDPNNSGKSSLMMLPVVFVLVSFLVIRDPDANISVFLSWFPLTSSSAMPIRWALTEVGFWQLTCSFVILVMTFYLIRILAAKIFRVSILISGKEPSFAEVIKLARHSTDRH